MTLIRWLDTGTTVAVLATSGAACTNNDPVAQPTTPPPTTSAAASESATPIPTHTPTLSQRQQAKADAIAVVSAYYALWDKLAAKPPGIPDAKRQLQAVATSDGLAYVMFDVGQLHAAKKRQTGMISIINPHVEAIDLTFKPDAKLRRVPGTKIRVCRDVSDLDLFDAADKSLANPKRQMRRISHVEVVNAAWPSRAGWRVHDFNDEATAC